MLKRPTLQNLVVAALCLALAGCGAMSADRSSDRTQHIADVAGTLSPEGLVRLQQGMDGGALKLAARLEPGLRTDFWGRPAGWTSLSLAKPPAFPFAQLSLADAAQLNAMLPVGDLDLTPAQPFFLRASGAERDRAVLCMTQAIYYEAALQPTEGQQAVAQTVLNRVRHPAFPKSICGVVYQGADSPPGCQFSFTCDGSLVRQPIEPYWTRAKTVALAALSGFVARDVGSATHYHADYVFPRWGPQMVKIVQLGAHIFYRYPGPLGDPQLLDGRYAGNELATSLERPLLAAQAMAKAGATPQLTLANLNIPGGVQAVTTPGGRAMLMIPGAATGAPSAVITDGHAAPGQMIGGRRVPTREEIAKINAALPPLPVMEVPAAAKPEAAKPTAPTPAG